MLNYLVDFIEKRKFEKKLLLFYGEVAQNWENWHVMHQRNVLDKFKMDVWLSVKMDPRLNSSSQLSPYVQKLTHYNQSMDEYRTYEQWYASDIKNKVTDNARVLHAKKEAAAVIFKDLLAVVEPLKKELETQLFRAGIVKNEQKTC